MGPHHRARSIISSRMLEKLYSKVSARLNAAEHAVINIVRKWIRYGYPIASLAGLAFINDAALDVESSR